MVINLLLHLLVFGCCCSGASLAFGRHQERHQNYDWVSFGVHGSGFTELASSGSRSSTVAAEEGDDELR